MEGSLKISNFDKSVKPDGKGNKNVNILIDLQNTSAKTISEYGAVLNISDGHQTFNKEIKIDTEISNTVPENLAPEKIQTVTWSGKESKHDADSLVANLPNVKMTIDYIRFTDGTDLRLHHKWESE